MKYVCKSLLHNMPKNRILFVVNAPEFFVSHRLPVALAARSAGYDVHIATANGPSVDVIKNEGFTHYIIPFSRSGQNPFNELYAIFCLYNLFRRLKPDLVHLVTIKPILYGGIAARLSGVNAVVAAVSGLGTVFLADSVTRKVRKWLVAQLYSFSLKQKKLAVIFQNGADRNTLMALGSLDKANVHMIRGSGVALNKYPFVSEPEGIPVAVMASRLLKDKGVFEFVEAGRLLKKRGVDVTMRLIGATDPGNPTSVTHTDLELWRAEKVVEVLGFRKDIAEQYAAASIVCLPSCYGEGLPKSLVEAAACGRAVITTDHPGCRDAIIPSVTGLLVPIKDPVSLADSIQHLVEENELRKRMGQEGRWFAEEVFAIEKIVDQHMVIYRELLES
jgi:glycosyltransferase involved in cell wall biosynthesis